MNTLLQRLKGLARWKKIAAVAAVIVLAVIINSARKRPAASDSVTVTRGSISQTVSVTGRMKPTQEVQLSFQNSGRVAHADTSVGQQVTTGQVLASLDNAELAAQLRDAQAAVAAQQAKLDELLQGPRPDDVAIKESELSKARQDLQNAYDNAYTVLSDALTKADNAVRIQLADIFDQVGTVDFPSYKLSFSCFCDQMDLTVANQRNQIASDLAQLQTDLNGIIPGSSNDVLQADLQRANFVLQSVKMMLENLTTILNDPSVGLPADTQLTYKTSVSTARAGTITALTTVATQIQTITSNRLIADRVAGEFAKLQNGSTPQAIASQRAQVQSAQAQADRITAQISKGVIRSPITGIVTQQDAKVGQSATANVTLISVISDQQLEIEANVPEVDIGKIVVADAVSVSVDALPGEQLHAHVSFIDPAETIIDGVVNFRVTMQLDAPDAQLKSGLTVNLDIETTHKDDTLILPQYAIIQNDQGVFVSKLNGTTATQTPVTLGIRSQDGNVEILSGLQEGDVVENVGLKKTP